MWYNLYKSLKIVKRYYIWIVRIFLMDWKRCILIFDSDWLKKKKDENMFSRKEYYNFILKMFFLCKYLEVNR